MICGYDFNFFHFLLDSDLTSGFMIKAHEGGGVYDDSS